MKIGLSPGHIGKTGSRCNDRGAHYKDINEANLVMLYAVITQSLLEIEGHNVYLLSYGNYSVRQNFCKDNNIKLHLQLHLNAGKGSYSLIRYRKNNGVRCSPLSHFISKEFDKTLPIKKCKILPYTSKERGYVCTMGDRTSLLLEPLFLDNSKHFKELIDGDAIWTISKAITNGIVKWIEGGD